jgi:alpha-tubulin suppressor-like RCC1 family protein
MHASMGVRHVVSLASGLALLGAGCSLESGGLGPSGPRDAGMRDSGPDVCVPAGDEACNEIDDDCDGRADEGFDIARDVLHCGACGMACASGTRSVAACTDGVCGLVCDPGFADCDGAGATGCEASLTDPGSCGACGTVCSGVTPLCGTTDGAIECVSACPRGATECSGSCVDTETDTSHCGACDMPCAPRTGLVASCERGACVYECGTDRGDCDGVAANGCETDTRVDARHCGACDSPCMLAGATAVCDASTCAIGACDANVDDCDMDVRSGCETSLETLTDCGGCGTGCAFEHAEATCPGGTCTLGACDTGFGDCNTTAMDGCETDLGTTLAHCGMCGRACTGGATCVAGTCVLPANVVEVASGGAFSCGRTADGRVYCWGEDSSGQLGNGAPLASSSTAVPVTGITNALRISAGVSHACALRADRTVVCWGRNNREQLGLGEGMTADQSSPAVVLGITDAVDLSCGGEHTCVVRATGAISCWGRNHKDQLGRSTMDTGVAADVFGVTGGVQVACGAAHTCVRLGTGSVTCWGHGAAGQLGRGTNPDRSITPTAVMMLPDAIDLDAGYLFTCAVRVGGTVWCWGDNGSGQIGDDTTTDRMVPTLVMMSATAVEVDAGEDHACLRTTMGTLTCWGLNGAGQLGDDTTVDHHTASTTVLGITDAGWVSAGGAHTCAARLASPPMCWGLGAAGQLGNNMTGDQRRPVGVMGLP